MQSTFSFDRKTKIWYFIISVNICFVKTTVRLRWRNCDLSWESLRETKTKQTFYENLEVSDKFWKLIFKTSYELPSKKIDRVNCENLKGKLINFVFRNIAISSRFYFTKSTTRCFVPSKIKFCVVSLSKRSSTLLGSLGWPGEGVKVEK